MIGKTLEHYQITSQLGKGGMGEVYQAKDSKLGRDVAIKVLPEEFAKDADRVARFQREAKLLASLNHPNIAAIYGLEESGGTNFLVLELVEGETLADRIKAGPIPVEEALKLALQISEALEAAHEKGVIHRDLKPANIKVTPDGKVKVLDFGLAKAFAGEQAEMNLSASPTLSHLATQQGIILGTAAYMAPEQAKGKTVDKRADIWAFGCVLYEILTGHAAFQGEDVTEILAAVVKGGANLDLLPSSLHPRVREAITRCLQKDVKKRYSSITDARYEIEQALDDPSGLLVKPVTAVETQTRLRTILPWVTAVLGIIIVGAVIWNLKKPEPRQVIRLDYELPEGQQLSDLGLPTLAVSPDGKQFVYSTPKGLYLRSVDQLTARLIAGTEEHPEQPFFSPDGKWIAYSSGSEFKLKKIAVAGGAPVALCDLPVALEGASWGADDTIVYGQYGGDIMRISANGGTPESIVKAESRPLILPQILPDGKTVLFTHLQTPNRIMVKSLKSGESRELFAGDCARYLSTGHIVYAVGNNLLAVPFDPDRLEVLGGGVPVVEGVFRSSDLLHYALSDSGMLVYIPGTTTGAAPSGRTLAWVDRNGKEEPLGAPPDDYDFPKISPDGTRVAVNVNKNGKLDIWIWDSIRKTRTRLTFDKSSSNVPIWTPDGKRIVFGSNRDGTFGIYWKAADGTGKEEKLVSTPDWSFLPGALSRDGKTLTMIVAKGIMTPATNHLEIGMLPMEGERVWKPLLREEYSEMQPEISPDGRWIAYTSNESGRGEVYVRPFPDVGKGKWQVSTSGGNDPLWSADGRELLYLNAEFSVMSIEVKTQPTFSLGVPRILLRSIYAGVTNYLDTPLDISPDGKRLLIMKQTASTAGGGPRKINIVINWLEELKQRVPRK